MGNGELRMCPVNGEIADVSSVMSTLKMNGDMALSIAKVLAWRCEPVCRATFGPVVHAKQSL